ncbi:MAG TPA: DNA primase [Caulobacteraceae bacterium]|jgi:DNA primase
MRFDDRFLEEIKARVRLSDVIGRTVKLRRQGREYAGLSPFSKEKTPSFFVNDDKGFWHDFSSGKHGDLISFLQETERLSFTEAVERLAAEAGVPLPAPDPRAAREAEKRQGLADWVEAAAAWFEAELRRPSGREARDYLTHRGLKEPEWARFRIGHAPAERTRLKDYLVAKGAKPAELVEAGLMIAPEDGGAPYDRFRERVIFPIADGRGRIISFGGRALNPEARAKYLNGPDTSLFDKSRTLYGLPEARRLLHAGGEGAALVVVEGYMDVIACQRAGVAAAAPMGTSLTEQQMEMLWRLHPEPTLAFDADPAGRRAAGRAIDRALPLLKPGRSFRFAALTGGKDADDVLREQGPGALKAQLGSTTPFVEALFIRERDLEPLDTPERRASFKARLRRLSFSITDRDLSEQYWSDLRDKFYTAFNQYKFKGGSFKADTISAFRGLLNKSAKNVLEKRVKRFHASVAEAAKKNPKWLADYIEEFATYGFGRGELQPLMEPLLDTLQEGEFEESLAEQYIYAAGVQELYQTVYRIAHEVPVLAFLVEGNTDAEKQWQRSFRAVVGLAAIEQELADSKESHSPGAFQRRIQLRTRRLNLERMMSDLTILQHDDELLTV